MKLLPTLRSLPFALGLATSSLGLLAPGSAQAAINYIPVTWGAATTVSGDLDILTTGSLVYAYNFGDTAVTSQTVNGVTFAAGGINSGSASAIVGSVNLFESPGLLVPVTSLGSGSAPYNSLSASYQSLLSTGISASIPPTISVFLTGLTVGQQYSLQLWTSDSSGTRVTATRVAGGTFGAITVDLDANTTDVAGGLGQYVIGTFTASSVQHKFSLAGLNGGMPLIDALQLRTYAPAAVPLPGTLALLLAALPLLAGLAGRRGTRA